MNGDARSVDFFRGSRLLGMCLMRNRVTVLAIVLLCVARTSVGAQAFDVLIRNGHIMDGTGSPWYSADLGIRDGRIAAIGRLPGATARTVIDARNLLVTPGFIDMLGQSELTILVEPHLPSKIFQGITIREEHRLTLQDAIRKFTSLPAQRLGLAERGVLKQGLWADITIFDPEQIHDVATFENPNQLSVGMHSVLVNGVPVIAGGKATQALPGKVLQGPGYLQ